MPAPVFTYVLLAAGFSAGWAIRSATLRRDPAPIPLPVESNHWDGQP